MASEITMVRNTQNNPRNAIGGGNRRKSILDIVKQMNRIAFSAEEMYRTNPNHAQLRYLQANRIAEQYKQNIRDRLEANGVSGPIIDLKAPRYVYRYKNRE